MKRKQPVTVTNVTENYVSWDIELPAKKATHWFQYLARRHDSHRSDPCTPLALQIFDFNSTKFCHDPRRSEIDADSRRKRSRKPMLSLASLYNTMVLRYYPTPSVLYPSIFRRVHRWLFQATLEVHGSYITAAQRLRNILFKQSTICLQQFGRLFVEGIFWIRFLNGQNRQSTVRNAEFSQAAHNTLNNF